MNRLWNRLQWPVWIVTLVLVTQWRTVWWLWMRWSASPEFTYGLVVFPAALGCLMGQLAACSPRTRISIRALLSLLSVCLIQATAVWAQIWFIQGICLPAVLAGCIVAWYGRVGLQRTALSLLFIAATIPWPDMLVDTLAVPMQHYSAAWAARLLSLTGLFVERMGVTLSTSHYSVEISLPCSGMRTLMPTVLLAVMAAVSAVSAPWPARVALGLAGAPLAVAANVLRICCIMVAGHRWGETAGNTVHDTGGYAVVLLSGGVLLGLNRLIQRGHAERHASAMKRISLPAMRTPRSWVLLVVVLVFGAALIESAVWLRSGAGAPVRIEPPETLLELPIAAKDGLDPEDANKLHADCAWNALYVGDTGRKVALTIIGGRQKQTLHAPTTCLPGSGWVVDSTRTVALRPDGEGTLAVIVRRGVRAVAGFAFVNTDTVEPSAYRHTAWLMRARLQRKPTSSALVRVLVADKGELTQASELAERALQDAVRHARERIAASAAPERLQQP